MQLSVQALAITLILILYIISAHIIERKNWFFLHESAIAIIIGFIIGLILNLTQYATIKFDEEIFFTMILPPIIFAAGYTLKKRNFFANIKHILLYGLIGTITTFIILTSFASVFIQIGFLKGVDFTIFDCMLLAVILASTDTVAPLSLIKEKQFPKLNSILFGEGLVNDAVSILLFRTVKEFVDAEQQKLLSFSNSLVVLGNFVYLAVMSLAIGISCGLILAFLFKKKTSFKEHPVMETGLITLIGYLSYLISETFKFSGIISLFSCGITMAHYTWHNISTKSQNGTALAFETIGYVAEGLVFVYLGLSIYSTYAEKSQYFTLWFSIAMFLGIMITRFFVVFLPPIFLYIFKRESSLSLRDFNIIWYGGLIRGAISFALSYQVKSPNKHVIVTTTATIVIFSSLFLAVFLQTFSKIIGLTSNSDNIDQHLLEQRIDDQVFSPNRGRVSNLENFNGNDSFIIQKNDHREKRNYLHTKWTEFDYYIMKPIFGGEKSQIIQEINLETRSFQN